MRRWTFTKRIGRAVVAPPLAVHAERAAKLQTIGLLRGASVLAWSSWTGTFQQRLRELGWNPLT
jgi:hypothetical protein